MKNATKSLLIATLAICVLFSSVQKAYAEETVDYEALFERALAESNEQIANGLTEAFFADIAVFMEELAFQDAQTKQAVIDLFAGEHVTSEQFLKIYERLTVYPSKRPTQSETDFVAAFKSAVSYIFHGIADNTKDIAALLAETMSVNDGQAEGFSYDLAKATIADPAAMIHMLAEENAEVQERILTFFMYEDDFNPFHGTHLKEKLTAVRETEEFTEAELELLDTIVGYYAESPAVTPPADPDPAELEAWLLKKQEEADQSSKTGDVFPSVLIGMMALCAIGGAVVIRTRNMI